TPRAGFDLAVTRTPEENLRSAPAGALVGKLPQGFVLTKVNDGDADRWVHVTRTGWVQTGDVEPVAMVVSSRTAADSDTAAARLTPGRSPGDEGTPGHRQGVSRGDTSVGASDPTRVESARRHVSARPRAAAGARLRVRRRSRREARAARRAHPACNRPGHGARARRPHPVPGQPGARPHVAGDAAMNEILRDRLQRKLEALPEDKAYLVLDYVEFLESKYAERPAGAAPFQRVAETLEDTLRAGRVPVNIIRGTMDGVGKAGKILEKFA